MNELLFISIQFPASYISTLIWFRVVLPLAPSWVQTYRSYDVVRAVDYLESKSIYNYSTWIMWVIFMIYYPLVKGTGSTSAQFPLWFSFMSWVNVFCMEIALQISGKRKLNFKNSAYWIGSNAGSLMFQTIREGSVCFGLPAFICIGIFEKEVKSIFWMSVVFGLIEFSTLLHMLLNVKKRQKREFGSTSVTGRRSILDTIAYRFGELYVIYYVYNLYQETFLEMMPFIITVTIYRSLSLGLFFAFGTYFGQTWIDAGPKRECEDSWTLNILGLAFRVFESTLSGYPKTIVLTVMFQKWLEKNM